MFLDMRAALQQTPAGAVGSKPEDKTEGRLVINVYLDEC